MKFIFFLILFIFSIVNTNSFSGTPASPSSSYKNDYLKKDNSIINVDTQRVAPQNIQFIVQGNVRLDSSLILRDADIDSNKTDPKNLSMSVKNLYKTGYYENVNIYKQDNIIFISVKENPLINQVSIEGNEEISDEIIKSEIETKPRNVYSMDVIKNDVKKIQAIYKRQGFFSTFIEPKYIKNSGNRVDIVFEIYEGKEAKIKRINFLNNKVFSDSTLEDVISSAEYRWYEFWGSNDKFDKERINYDKDLLKDYYYKNGYIDFQILSVNSSLVENDKDFIVNFTLFEGKRYRVNKIGVKSNVRNLSDQYIRKYVNIDKNDWYSSTDIDDSISNITDAASERGYAFLTVIPKIRKTGKETVNILFEIDQGRKIYIDRINIKGNIKTEDNVIRREMELSEGDPFNSLKLKSSERNIKTTGLFENVGIKVNEIPGSNFSSLDVELAERSTGEFSVGAGYSSIDGALGNVGIRESNVFGQAKELSLQLGLSTRRNSIDLSYTDPYFLNSDVAAGIDLFNIRRNNKIYSGYKHNIIGFKLRAGYEILDNFRHISSYALKRDKIHDIDNTTSTFIQSQEGKRTVSIIGQALQYDTLNDRINPTEGYRARVDVDYYGLTGDAEHLLTELKLANFARLADGFILGTFIEAGYIASIKKVKINNRFYLNGDRLRGFKNLGVGPRDSSTSDALGGEIYYLNRNELIFPLGLPDELAVKGLAFLDIGTLYNTSDSGTNIKDESSLRAAAGFGIQWVSPFGPIKFYLTRAFKKESYDKEEIFRFSFGTTY